MRELKATDKITQKMTRDGAVSENLATGEVKHISSREPEAELSASSEESAGAAADLALRAAEHHEKKSARKAEKADTQAVRDGSATRQRPSSRLQFTEEERADPTLGKYIDRSDRAADRLDAAKAAIPTKKILRTERVFDETAGKGKMQLHFEKVEKRPNGRLRHNPLSRPVHEIAHAAHAKVHEVEQENVGVEAGHKGEVLTERGLAYGKGKVRAAVHHHRTKPWRDAAKAEQASFKANADYLYQKALHCMMILHWRLLTRYPAFCRNSGSSGTMQRSCDRQRKPQRTQRPRRKVRRRKQRTPSRKHSSTSNTIAGRCCW